MCRIWKESSAAAPAVRGDTVFIGSTSCGVLAREEEAPIEPRVFGLLASLLSNASLVLGRDGLDLEPGRNCIFGVFARTVPSARQPCGEGIFNKFSIEAG